MIDTFEGLQKAVKDKYTIEREVGRGGMAVVYLARDIRHDRRIALKILRPELTASIGGERFLREIRIEASLQHPHILPLYDSGEVDNTLYYTMPFVEGETLRQRLARDKQLPVDDVVSITKDVTDAVGHAHSHGFVHRDLKPENILLSGENALVADFGVAHAVSEAGGEQLTESGIAIGTAAYMSPEQATGYAEIDGRSDIYSMGLVVYEMLAGEPPFTGTTPQMVMARQASERLPSLEIVRPNLPLELIEVVEKALAKVPADRYQTAQQFGEAVTTGASGKTRVLGPRPRRKKWSLWTGVVTALVAATVMLWCTLVSPPGLDSNVVVLYPLEWGGPGQSGNGAPGGAELGENTALFVLAALDGKASLRWVNGWDLLDDRQRENPRLVRQSDKVDLARAHHGASYVDGRVVPLVHDSVRIHLQLHRVASGAAALRPVVRVDTAGPINKAEQLGLLAAGELVLSLLPSGELVDVSDLAGRKPEAIQYIVQGERDFTAARFAQAYDNYREAVAVDPEFALAAVRAAQTASWNHEADDARELIDLALANEDALAPKAAQYARGFRAYFRNQGDSAVHYFERAIALDPDWPAGWMGLGEAYSHLLPGKTPQDSLGRAAFERVHDLSESFAPGLFHLIEYAIRAGEHGRASRLIREYRRADSIAGRSTSDTLNLTQLELMLRCAEHGPESIDWQAQVLADVNHVFQVAKKSSVAGAYTRCALAAYGSIADNYQGAWLFSSLVGLMSNLAATGQLNELRAVADSAGRIGTWPGQILRLYYVVAALAGLDVRAEAQAVADSLRVELDYLSPNRKWFVAIWDAYNGRLGDARRVRDELEDSVSAIEGSPTEADLVNQLDGIERDLEQAIREQEFELAAALRDRRREVDSVLKKSSATAVAELDSLERAKQQAVLAEDFERAQAILARQREIRAGVRDNLRQDQLEQHRKVSLVAHSIAAHITLAEGDTAEAILQFSALVPGAKRGELAYPWESLGLERLLEAQLLLAWGDYEEAYDVATTFDAPGAVNVVYSLFLRQSLEVRFEAAREMGDESLERAD
jgi:tRNA A-37 threonylcarbamoyl transferase component Bud32/tetratricopeptide (TPR) repeat protein